MKLLITISIFLTLFKISFSETYLSDRIWGKGIIAFNLGAQQSYYDVPVEGIACFDKEKKEVGKIKILDNQPFIVHSNGSKTKLELKDFERVGYEPAYLRFYDSKNHFAKVLEQTYDLELWISIDSASNASAYTYLDLIKKTQNKEWAIVTGQKCLTVWDNNDSLGCINNTHINPEGYGIDIIFLGEFNKNLAKVSIKIFDFEDYMVLEPAQPARVITEYTGWVKLIDKNGFPNIWYYWDAY